MCLANHQERAKEEVILSLIPLFIFIVFVLYAFCRLGVFAVCNPLKVCPRSADDTVNVPALTPKKLIAYKRGMVLKKAAALAAFQQVNTSVYSPKVFKDMPICSQFHQCFTRIFFV